MTRLHIHLTRRCLFSTTLLPRQRLGSAGRSGSRVPRGNEFFLTPCIVIWTELFIMGIAQYAHERRCSIDSLQQSSLSGPVGYQSHMLNATLSGVVLSAVCARCESFERTRRAVITACISTGFSLGRLVSREIASIGILITLAAGIYYPLRGNSVTSIVLIFHAERIAGIFRTRQPPILKLNYSFVCGGRRL